MPPKKGSSLGRKTKAAASMQKLRVAEDEAKTQERLNRERAAWHERQSQKTDDQRAEQKLEDKRRRSAKLKTMKKVHKRSQSIRYCKFNVS